MLQHILGDNGKSWGLQMQKKAKVGQGCSSYCLWGRGVQLGTYVTRAQKRVPFRKMHSPKNALKTPR